MNMYQSVTDQVTINQIKQQFELENPGQKFPKPKAIFHEIFNVSQIDGLSSEVKQSCQKT